MKTFPNIGSIGKKRIIAVCALLALLLLGVAAFIIADEVTSSRELPLVGQADSGIKVKNVWASDITKSSARINLSLSKTYIAEYKLYLGSSPDNMQEVDGKKVGKNTSTLAAGVDGLSEYTRYYYSFHLLTADSEIVLDTWSFITPNSYFNGSSGGRNDENTSFGIDVSFWCQSSDFEKAKADGVEFVIIRAGSSGNKDPYFEENYERARAAGLHVGAYYYTYAMSLEEAENDADEFLEFICGKEFDMPVYVDIENEKQQSLSRPLLTEMVLTFCDKIADAGYYSGVYANRNWFNTLLNFDTLASTYELWIAQWTESGEPNGDYSENYGMWQYYDKGKVSGVQGNADLNVCYKDYSSIIKNEGTVPYDFVNYDGEVICRYYMYPGARIYTPSIVPEHPSDDLYSYEFVGWDALDENTVATETGGSFKANFDALAHSYGDWDELWVLERTRVCEDCGYVQHEILGDVTCGENASWYFSDGVLTISGGGAISDGDSPDSFGWAVVADKITKIKIGEGITSVGNFAFSSLENLSSVSLPMTLSSIGNSAFENCTSLESILIPVGVTSIADNAFYGCRSLKSISGYENGSYTAAKTLAGSLGVRYKKSSIRLAYYGKTESEINWYIYTDGSLTLSGIGETPASLSFELESYRDIILSVSVGAGVKSIPENFLIDAKKLWKLEFLGDRSVKIGKNAFYGCSMLTELTIPRGCDIAEGAFVGTPLVE